MEIELHEGQAKDYTLQSAIMLYGNGEHAIARQHDIIMSDGKPRLGAGTFVTTALVEALLNGLQAADLVFIPANVLAASRNAIAWYQPAGRHAMHFQTTTDEATQSFDRVPVPLPALVFIATPTSLSVFALAHDTRPVPTSPLYHAPFFNVYENGQLCLGTMLRPKDFSAAAIPSWTKSFFLSAFTHLSSGKRWTHEGTYAQLLQAACDRGQFDPTWLKPTSCTLEKAITTCGNSVPRR